MKPYSTLLSPPLPELRVKEAAAFSFTGVDIAGPLYIRGNEKVWICLYTCGATRAVHLEIVPGLSAQTFILCFGDLQLVDYLREWFLTMQKPSSQQRK